MWAVRIKDEILAVFDDRWEAEEYAREWRSLHGVRCKVVRTEN
jgi:hypothetical protein